MRGKTSEETIARLEDKAEANVQAELAVGLHSYSGQLRSAIHAVHPRRVPRPQHQPVPLALACQGALLDSVAMRS